MAGTLLERRRPFSHLAALAALPLLLALLAVQMDLVFAMDDYFYGTLWRDGLAGGVYMNWRHYLGMNGRVLVHLAAQLVLLPASEELCGAVDLLLLCAVAALAWRALGAGAFGTPLSFALPLAAALLLMRPETLRETLLWPSAYYNYAFPMLFLMAQLWAMGRWLEEGTRRRGLLCALCSLLAGATTELYGAMAMALACAVPLARLLRVRSGWARGLLSPSCAAAGLLTVVLSPATRARMAAEMSVPAGSTLDGAGLYAYRWARLGEVLFAPAAGSAAAVLTVLFAAACLLGLLSRRRRPLLLWGGAACLLWLLPTAGERLLLSVAAAAALALALLCMEGLAETGALLAAGGAAALAICMTGSVAPRTAFPFLLCAALAAGRLWAEALDALDRLWAERPAPRPALALWGAALILASAGTLAAFAPTRRGVADNHALDLVNRAAAAEAAAAGGDCRYNMDYDERYCYMGIYRYPTALRDYLTFRGLEEEQVYFTSASVPYVEVEGRRLRNPPGLTPLMEGQPRQLPVVEVLESLGGTAEQGEDGSLRLALDGRSCVWKDAAYTFTDRWGDEVTYTTYSDPRNACTLLPPEVLSIVFGIRTEYDGAENCYRLTYAPEGAAAGAARP